MSYRSTAGTAAEREQHFAVRDVKQARAARELMRRAGYPSVSGMTRLINNGGLINSPATAEDLRRADQIWGPDPASIQGKTTGHTSPLVPAINVSGVPDGQITQELHCDLMFVDGVAMLVGVAKPLQMINVLPITNKSAASLKRSITQLIDVLAAQLPAGVNITAATEAVPAAERSIRSIKNTMRSIVAGLPFAVPRKLVVELARYAARRLNAQNTSCLPAGTTAHEIFSACIALRPTGNAEGSWVFYNLATGKTCTRHRFTQLPITEDAINTRFRVGCRNERGRRRHARGKIRERKRAQRRGRGRRGSAGTHGWRRPAREHTRRRRRHGKQRRARRRRRKVVRQRFRRRRRRRGQRRCS
mmetsp:Transcript_19348/g.48398  ORF Transcript_19348/g.48398 Transcript_19348/m.48398 type:complete len:360 (+) Transcript_19348:578-1657(+)